MLNWWSTLDIRGRFFFRAIFCLATSGVVFATMGVIMVKLIIAAVIMGVIGFFCVKDDSTEI